jgi:SpoVK/Ycf46/Vps4 family AAA+-type ATPase
VAFDFPLPPPTGLYFTDAAGNLKYLGDVEYFKMKIAQGLGVSTMFADENGDVAVLEPEVAAPDDAGIADEPVEIEEDEKKAPDGTAKWPAFIVDIDNFYRANRAHVFALHGNVNDYPDNTGIRGDLGMTLFTRYDKFWLTEKVSQEVQNTGKKVNIQAPRATNVAARFTVPDGLVFATTGSFQAFADIVRKDPRYAEAKDEQLQPKDLPGTLILLNDYFKLSAMRFAQNQPLRTKLADKDLKTSLRAAVTKELAERPEINLTVLFYDAKMCFPAGQVSSLTMDRTPIAYIENWALNGAIAPRNKIILIAQRLQDLQESLRSGDSRVAAIRVKRPTLEERREWLEGFESYIKVKPALINGAARTSITLADDLTWDILANNTAGMSRVQIEGVFMESWLQDVPVDLPMIADHKKKSLAAEYGDILDIRQPIPTTLCPETKGQPEEKQRAAVWNLLGGHDLLKLYAEQWVMEPMLLGDRRRTTRGFLLVGPPGTGKTWYGELLAAVCRINFVYVDFSKLYGGIVGETERNTERLYEAIEAMAPCIVFADEIDSAFSSGRQSEDARWGKVIVLAATNRPDLLDEAFIRAGRFDDVIPALPPHPSDAKGRKSLLAAVCKKTGVRVLKSLVETLKTPNNGLGRLIFSPRVWTGAEVERLVKMAFGNAAQRVSKTAKDQAAAKKLTRRETIEFLRTETKNPLIELDDWNHAMDSYRPNTRQVETQIDLALGYSNNDDYCPAEWRSRLDQAREKTAAIESAASYGGAAGAYERD